MSDKNCLKILCLHGYRQNSQSFKAKSGGFRKVLKNHFEFVIIDAPHQIPLGEQNPNNEQDCLSWWFSGENPDYFSSKHLSNYVKGYDESMKKICDSFEKMGPFDGLLGFSQGASLVALICILKHFNEFPYDFKFVILCSGFKSLTSSHVAMFDRLADQKIRIPSLHIIGENDQVVDHDRSESLANDYFYCPFIIKHAGGHTIPSQTSFRPQYLNFLDKLNDFS
ncbi:esterase CBG03338 [Dermatophagoides farinae]|uniref:Serine hydrolase-like protein n=1 Tax=Dermatophagoides farinae TaxID=6954 RepID=A0A9D4SCK5_DERFA|nr:esterase CBG03338-like [Dermatophagoides farinae]XP_046914018.1 esterase CBG03338-like [Dermatophagoides farinae]KAH7636653.1 serine hydrolase-like protein [Dermatophagoides farinae]